MRPNTQASQKILCVCLILWPRKWNLVLWHRQQWTHQSQGKVYLKLMTCLWITRAYTWQIMHLFLFPSSVSPPLKEVEKAEPPIPKAKISSSVQAVTPTAAEDAPPTCSQSASTEAPPPSPTSEQVRLTCSAALPHSNTSVTATICYNIQDSKY